MSGTISSEILADADITLSGTYIAQLPAGLTDYSGMLSGSGMITLGDTGAAAATLELAADTILLAPAESEVLAVNAGTLVSIDVTAAMTANQPIFLSSVPLSVALPNGSFYGFGTINYTGSLTGAGSLIVTGQFGNALVLPGGYRLQLGSGDTSPLQTVTVNFASSMYTTNWDASVAAGEVINLNSDLSIVNLVASITQDGAGIAGTGTLAVTSAPTGGGIFEDGGLILPIGGANQTWDVSFGTATSVMLTTPLLDDWDIDLAYNGAATLAHAGVTAYTGRIEGNGAITVSAAASGGGTLIIAGSVAGSSTPPFTLDLPDAGQTEVITLNNGAWSVDYSAAMAADDDIILSPTSTATLAAGTTSLTREFTGTGSLVITGGSTAASTLAISNDKFIVASGASETLSVSNGTVTSVDVTTAMELNDPVYLSTVPLTVELPWGQFFGPGFVNDTNSITGSGDLIVTGQFGGLIELPGGFAEQIGSGDTAPRQTVTISVANGVYSTDWTESVDSGEMLDFVENSTIWLSAGTVTDTNQISGSGPVTLSTGAGGPGTWVSEYGTLALGSANETEVFTFANNAWSIGLGSLVTGNDAIVLSNIIQSLSLASGVTSYTGTLTGHGVITVTAAGPGTLVADGRDFVFTEAGETQLISLANGVWSQDVTAALLADDNLVLTGNAAATLPAGTTNYTGSISGTGTLTLIASATGPSTLVIGNQSFYLTAANEILPVSLANGDWTQNISNAVAQGQQVILTGAATLNLGAGTFNDAILGAGSIVVSSDTAAGVLDAGGVDILSLPDANETVTLSLAAGSWSEDVSAAFSGNQDIALLGNVVASARVGAGMTTYTGTISGSGTLVITASGYPARLVIPGAGSAVLTASDPAETLIVSNGLVTLDASAAIAASQTITLNGSTSALLANGTVHDTGTISGAGVLAVTAGASGSVFIFDGDAISLPNAGETVLLTLTNGAAVEDLTQAAQADAAIVLGNLPAALDLTYSNLTDSNLSGTGNLTIETNVSGESFYFNGGSVLLANSFETLTASFINGVETNLDISKALGANQHVNLNVHGSATLAAGTTDFSNGGITNINGVALALTAAGGGPSTLVVGNTTFGLNAAGETETYTYENGNWTADASAAFAAGQNIDLSVPTAVTLSAGTTNYHGIFGGPDFLTLVGNASAASMAIFNGQNFTLAPGASEALAFTGSNWVPELNVVVAANQNITLNGTAALLLGPGDTNYGGTLSGTGDLIVNGAGNGTSVLAIGGTVLTLPTSDTETLIVGNGTVTGVDISQAVLADQPIALSNLFALLELPSGDTVFTGALNGAGTIKLSAGASGGTIVIGGVTYGLAANASETVTIASVNVSSNIAADQPITLSNVNDIANLAAGSVIDTSTITGTGTLAVTASNGPATLVVDGDSFLLPIQGDVLTLSRSGGAWQQNVTSEIFTNQNILLSGNVVTDAYLPGSNLDYTGTFLGSGQLVLTNQGGADSFIDGTLFQQLIDSGESLTFDVSNNTVSAVDISSALAANDVIALNENGIATLAPGTTTYTPGNGNLVIGSNVTLALAASANAPSTLVDGGIMFAIPMAGETENFVNTSAGWRLDATHNFNTGQNIVLDTPAIVTLAAGVTTYTGTISGMAPLSLANGGAASTAIINGQTFVLGSAAETETLSMVNGTWVQDISAAIAANKIIILNGNSIVANLAAGLTSDTGTITGAGRIIVTSSNTGPSTLAVEGQIFTFGQANETETLSLAGGTWNVDVTQAITDQQVLVLNGAETVHLAAGFIVDGASITGAGSVVVQSGSVGNQALVLNHSGFILPDASETVTLTQIGSSGVWQENLNAVVAANQDIQLNSSTPAILTLGGGTTDYTGTVSNYGVGTLMVTAAQPNATLVIQGQTLALPVTEETETLLDNGGNWSVDLTAALAANEPIAFTDIPAMATLTGGTQTYSAAVTGYGSLTIIATTASTLLLGGQTFALAAGQSETLYESGGEWSGNITNLLQAGDAVALATHDTLTLPYGILNATGAVTGNGTVTVTTGYFGGTLVLDGQDFVLPGYQETELLVLAGGIVTEDITAAVTANEPVQLSGTNALLSLSGSVTDSASISGNGALTLISGSGGGGTVAIAGGQIFVLGGANESATATLANGSWTTNLSGVIAAGDPVVVASSEIATLSAGTIKISSLGGDGTLVLTAAGNAASTLSVTGGDFVGVAAGQSVTLMVAGSHVNADVTFEIADHNPIVLRSDASAFLPAGNQNDTGGVSGNGELTLFGNTNGTTASIITLDGATYTIAADSVLGLNFSNGIATVDGETSTTAPIDITAAIDANQQNILLNGGKYIIYVPAGRSVSYSGVMSGTGTLEVAGGGTLTLTNNSNFALPADQSQETIVNETPIAQIYDGTDLGLISANDYAIIGQNAPAVVVDAGTTLNFGDPNQDLGPGLISSFYNVSGASYNLDNIEVNGTLNVNTYYEFGYGPALGEVSGNGVINGGGANGTYFEYGNNEFSGKVISYSINYGGAFGSFTLPNPAFIDITQVVTFSVEAPTTLNTNTVTISSPIYSQFFSATILNQGFGLLIFNDVWNWDDSLNAADPSLSNPLLNYTTVEGNFSQRTFDAGNLQQFGNGSNALWFMPGNASTTTIYFAGGTVALDYNGTVHIDTSFGPSYYPLYGSTYQGNLIVVGTSGNHVIYTEQMQINGFTQIDANAMLQLGDGTQGNSQTITTASATGPVTGVYSTSGGNGALLTAESAGGAATDHIINNGQLIVDNVNGALDGVGPISLSNISGTGSFYQEGTQLVTLLENTQYTGGTTIANGTLAIAQSSAINNAAGISASSGVTLTNASAALDISQAYNQTIQDLSGVAGSTVALGGNMLTLGTANSTVFDGIITDGGIADGTGGSLLKQGIGTLTLGGNNSYTGGTTIAAGTLAGMVSSFGSGQIVNDSNLIINQGVNGTLSNALSGNGTFIKQGAGNINLTAMTNYAGAISIAAGSITLSAATATINGPVSGAGTLVIANGASLTLQTAPSAILSFGPVSAGLTNHLMLPAGGAPLASLTNLAPGCVIEFAGDSQDQTIKWVENAPGSYSLYGVQTSGTMDLLVGSVSFAKDGNGNAYIPGDFASNTTSAGLFVNALCYLRGTHILTPCGHVPIEQLQIGDAVITKFGGYQRIKWIGQQYYARRFIQTNRNMLPVRIAGGALGPGLPLRDLYLSPGHSMLLDGRLVLAKSLVNGVTITQNDAPETVDYFQIELATHDCILAEGSWSETYADHPGMRAQFFNAASFYQLYPDYQVNVEPEHCAPLLRGSGLDAVLWPIVSRAADKVRLGRLCGYVDQINDDGSIEGWAQDLAHPDLPVMLEIRLHGAPIGTVLACNEREDLAQAGIGQGRLGFSWRAPIPMPPAAARGLTVRRAADGAVLMPTESLRLSFDSVDRAA